MYQWLFSSEMIAGFELRRAPSPPTNGKAISDSLTGVYLGFAWSGLLSNGLKGRRQPEGRDKGRLISEALAETRLKSVCTVLHVHTTRITRTTRTEHGRACTKRKKDKRQEGIKCTAHTNHKVNKNNTLQYLSPGNIQLTQHAIMPQCPNAVPNL